MEKVFVKPAQGLKVRDDKTKLLLPEEGKLVEKTSYWVRRLQCGDVVLVESVEKAEVKPEVKKVKKDKMGDE